MLVERNTLGEPFWWQWPTILSLDAPIVALLWQGLLARTAGIPIGWPHQVVLGLSVWLAYAADRWIEAWRLDAGTLRTQRHWFYQRRRWSVAATWTVAFVGVLYVAIAHLTTRELAAGSLLLGPVLAYLLSHQLVHRHHRWRVPKEICIALLLTGGVLVFLVPVSGVSALAAPAAALGVLCFTNCVLISSWERHIDEVHGQTSLATGLTPARLRQVAALPWLSAAVVLALLAGGAGLPLRTAACAGGSAILLGVIHHFQHRMGWQLARVLADAALMTPVLPLAWTL